MRVLLWHVHGSWTTSFVQGPHDYVVPVTNGRDADGLGRAQTWDWPSSVREVAPEELADSPFDVVVLQRPHEFDLAARWLGRRPGTDLAAVYLEHNTPEGPGGGARHPAADEPVHIVHVTHFNALMWDCGRRPVRVIDHGVVDPGHRYRGDVARAAVVINDPARRGRTTGTDLLARFDDEVGVDLFGMRSEILGGRDLPQDRLHDEMAHRRAYLHTTRWTSLGLSLIEAMHLGMPVVALATTEVPGAVPAEAGVVSTDPEVLLGALRALMAEPARAAEMGAAARRYALGRFGLKRFLEEWDELLEVVAS